MRPPCAPLLLTCSVLALATGACAQLTWVNVSPIVVPPQSEWPNMVYDSWRQRVVLVTAGQTWEWDGVAWTQMPTAPPYVRRAPSMAFDSVRRRVVLFGGYVTATSRYLGDTWEWDGTVWSLRAASGPSPRAEAGMAFYPPSGRIVLFGGFLNDTWTWDGNTWEQLAPAHAPPARSNPLLFLDPRRGRLEMMAGSPSYADENWEWDGTDWTQLPNTVGRGWGSVAYNAYRGTLMYFGNATWELTPSGWSQVVLRNQPFGNGGGSAISADVNGEILLFTGPTWVLATDCLRVAPGHPTGSIPLVCQTSPALGQHLCVNHASTQGFGMLMVGPGPCDTPLANVDPPLFCAHGSVHAQPWILLTSNLNPALMCLDIPFDVTLVGVRACLQSIALQPGNCLRLTDVNESRVRLR